MPIDEREQDNRTLRTLIITALTETGQTRDTLYAKIGEFYYCAAPKYLYKYYSENLLNMDAIKNHEMWYSAPCNFNDVFDCDVSTNEKALFESFLKANPQGRRIRQGSPMWIKLKSDVHKQIDYLQGTFEETKQTTGISCLSESDSSLLMWAHYANNHKGMCVEWSQVELWKQALFNPIIRIRVRPKGSLFQIGGDALCQKKGKKSCVWTPSGTLSITVCSGHLTNCTPKAKPEKLSPA